MSAPATATPPNAARSFAGMLASMAAPAPKPAPAWDDDGLADDVAVLSYEHALRTHARYRPAEHADLPAAKLPGRELPSQPPASVAIHAPEASVPPLAAEQTANSVSPSVRPAQAAAPALPTATLPQRSLKCASITIRMSEQECAQLRNRAAESGLTVSAYLRSCTFEAESLRKQVKEALAEMRAGKVPGRPEASKPQRTWRQILASLWPRFAVGRDTARA